MIIQNLKVAFRNLMKYKVQTLLSIASIAIGIVTLSLAFSVMIRFRLPSIMSQPFKDRAYEVIFKVIDGRDSVFINNNAFRALKADGGLRHADHIAALNGITTYPEVEFHLMDSTIRKGYVMANYIDPEYITYAGIRSAITGEKIKRLKKGEAIISEKYARDIFQNSNPIGAVQTLSNFTQSFPVTIVDICEESSSYDAHYYSLNNRFLFCMKDNIEDNIEEYEQYTQFTNVFLVLNESSTEQELVEEINERIKPYNQEARLSKVVNNQDIRRIVGIHILVYILSSLLLLAAIIGFLRMQIQLFWLRRREISLRIVNGAKRGQLFRLLTTEVMITLILSVILSVILGNLLEDYLVKNLGYFIRYDVILKNLWQYSLGTGAILLLICCVIAWIITWRISNAKDGLSKNMRFSRNHLFRNAMLGIQISISVVFVCLTFMLINGGNKLLDTYNIPENDDFYKGCLKLDMSVQSGVSEPFRLLDELDSLPDLDKIVSWKYLNYDVREIDNVIKIFRTSFLSFPCLPDTTLLSFFEMDIEWLNRDIDRNNCLLIGEEYYTKFTELGILENGTLSFKPWGIGLPSSEICLPVGGIIKKIPYKNNTETAIAISPLFYSPYDKYNRTKQYVLVPKPGKGKALERSVKELLDRTEPGRIELNNGIIQNYRSYLNNHTDTVETVTTLGWILGIVSVIICSMSILSTIMLDTRSRRKEVAIRKINGAKSIDIYRLFGRVYIVLLVLAVIVAIPVCVMFNGFVESYVKDNSTVEGFSPLWPVVLGISIVAVLILAIVGWQTHKMLRIDPAKIIAKE